MYFSVKKITVKKYRIICFVESCQGFEHTNSQLINIICNRYPGLPNHKCKNMHGTYFSDVMYDTTVAHLFEHLVIDLQTKAMLNNDVYLNEFKNTSIVGTTQKIEQTKGSYQVEFSYFDDCIALKCISLSEEAINNAFNTIEY